MVRGRGGVKVHIEVGIGVGLGLGFRFMWVESRISFKRRVRIAFWIRIECI